MPFKKVDIDKLASDFGVSYFEIKVGLLKFALSRIKAR